MTFLRLIRYQNLIMVLLTMVLVEYALFDISEKESSFSLLYFTITCFSILCLTAAGYVVNDIIDYKVDLINKPHKTFVGKAISIKASCWIYGILNVLGLLSCVYVIESLDFSYKYLWAYAMTILFLFLYSKYLKRIMLLGNLIISLFCSGIIMITFSLHIEGQGSSGSFWEALGDSLDNVVMFMITFYYVIFSFVTTLIREIIKDIDGDHQMKMKTLPIVLGRKRARNMAITFSLLLLLILLLVLNTLLEDPQFLFLILYLIALVVLPTVYFTYKLWSAKTKKQFHDLSSLMKIIMLSGILSMILFKFI